MRLQGQLSDEGIYVLTAAERARTVNAKGQYVDHRCVNYAIYHQGLIDSTRRGHVTSRNGEILIVTINRPLFSLLPR